MYWLPGITMGASGARHPVDISVNQIKLQVSKKTEAQMHT